jgi:transcriptional regulator with XRE-family HTH domain
MASYNTGDFLKMIRQRKELQIKEAAYHNSEMTVSRIEKGRSKPQRKTLANLMSTFNMPEDTFFCPYLDNQPLDVYELKDYITASLEHMENNGNRELREQAGQAIERLKNTPGFDKGINRQFILSCRARSMEIN